MIKHKILLMLLSSLLFGMTVHAQEQYATAVLSEVNVFFSDNSIDANPATYAELESGTGIIIGIGSYSSHIELQFPSLVPANQTSFVRIETEDNILSSLLWGATGHLMSSINGVALIGNQEFSAEVKNGATVVLSGSSTNPSSFAGERLKVVMDENGHYYLAITPNQSYQSIRITNFVGSLVGLGVKKRLKVWDPYYVTEGAGCETPKFTSFDVSGISLELLNQGGGMHHAERTIDGNQASHSTLSLGVVSVASNITQRAYLEGTSNQTDVIAVRLRIEPELLAMTLGQGIRIRTQEGALVVTTNTLQVLLTPANINELQEGNPTTVYIAPNAPVDRVVVELNGLLGISIAQELEVHAVYKIPPPPVLDAARSIVDGFLGTTTELVSNAVDPNLEIRWYADESAVTPVGITASAAPFTTGILTDASTTFYMAAAVPGCALESVRVPVTVNALPPPVIVTTGTPGVLEATYGAVSTSASVMVSGTHMSEGITVEAPDDFEISLDGVSFAEALSIGVSATDPTVIEETPVYVRLKTGRAVGKYTGDVRFISAHVDEVTVSVVGAATPRTLTVTADAGQGKTYGASEPPLTFVASGFALADDESIVDGTLSRIPGEDVDTYAIGKGTLDAGNNYTVDFTGADFAITPKALTVTADPGQGKVYGMVEPQLAFTASGFELADDMSMLEGMLSRMPGEDVDTYAMTVGTLDAGPNYTIDLTAENFTITPKDVTITADNHWKEYGEELTFTGTAFTVEGLESGDAVTYVLLASTGSVATADVDVYEVEISGAQGQGLHNYTVNYRKGTLAVTKATLTGIRLDDAMHAYDGIPKKLEVSGALPAGVAVSYTINGLAGNTATDIGEYRITVTVSGRNYDVFTDEARLTIYETVAVRPDAPQGLTVVPGSRQVTLNWTPPPVGAMPVMDYVIQYATSDSENWTTAAHAPITMPGATVIGLANNTVYRFRVAEVNALGTGAFSPVLAGVILTEPIRGVDGEFPQQPAGGVGVITDGKVEAVTLEVIDGTYLKLQGGDYAMELASLGIDGERIPISDIDAVIRLLRSDGARVYVSGHGFEPGTVVTVYLFSAPELVGQLPVDSDGRFVGTLPVPVHLEPGNHTLQVNGVVAGGNGERSLSIGLLLIDSKPQQIAFGTLPAVTYGEDPVILDATASSNLPVNYTVTDSEGKPTGMAHIENGNRLVIRGAGDVVVKALQDGNTEFAPATPVTRLLHIGKAMLEASVADAVRRYGEVNPVFEISYSGFVNGDDASSLGRTPSARTEAAETSAPDNYVVTLGGGVSANYAFIYVPAMLTITKATQSITLEVPATLNRDVGTVAITATSSSGLPVTLNIDDEQVAALNGSALDILRLGTVRITATQAGDGNHEAAEPVTVAVRVVDPASDFPVRVHQAVSPNGDGINEFLMVEGVRDYRENRVKVFNRNGTVVWEASGYDNDRIAFRGIGTGQLRLPAGTYFYVVEVRNDGGQWQHHSGYFVLRY